MCCAQQDALGSGPLLTNQPGVSSGKLGNTEKSIYQHNDDCWQRAGAGKRGGDLPLVFQMGDATVHTKFTASNDARVHSLFAVSYGREIAVRVLVLR